MRGPPLHAAIFQDRVPVRANGMGGLDLRRCALAAVFMFLLSHYVVTTSMVRAMVVRETGMDVGALDRRISVALQLFESHDPMAGEAELREMAEQYPSYAPPSFYLGLLSQSRQEAAMAIVFYAAALRAGILNWLLRLCVVRDRARLCVAVQHAVRLCSWTAVLRHSTDKQDQEIDFHFMYTCKLVGCA